jgi:hypothetical protein
MFNKLSELPTIYYLNLDSEFERRKYMEDQFEKWGLDNIKRFSASQYLAKDYNKWKEFLHFNDLFTDKHHLQISITLSTLEMIRYWLNNTDEKYLILMEDDYDLSLIEYWHFDWEYLMNNIPYNWDCIQLGYESHNHIKFFLHPKDQTSFFGPILINRHYAEKLIKLHFVKDRYILLRKYGIYPHSINYKPVNLDRVISQLGVTYQLPLITQNPKLDQKPKKHHILCRNIYYKWWRTERDKFSLRDFFTYGKPNDEEMTVKVE